MEELPTGFVEAKDTSIDVTEEDTTPDEPAENNRRQLGAAEDAYSAIKEWAHLRGEKFTCETWLSPTIWNSPLKKATRNVGTEKLSINDVCTQKAYTVTNDLVTDPVDFWDSMLARYCEDGFISSSVISLKVPGESPKCLDLPELKALTVPAESDVAQIAQANNWYRWIAAQFLLANF